MSNLTNDNENIPPPSDSYLSETVIESKEDATVGKGIDESKTGNLDSVELLEGETIDHIEEEEHRTENLDRKKEYEIELLDSEDEGEISITSGNTNNYENPIVIEEEDNELNDFKIPIILKTNNFPYLLSPISQETSSQLPSEYENAISLFDDDDSIKDLTLFEIFCHIRETFKEHDNPLDEDQDLVITFKELGLSLAETNINSYKVNLGEVITAFKRLSVGLENKAPKCLCLELTYQKNFAKELNRIKGLEAKNLQAQSVDLLSENEADDAIDQMNMKVDNFKESVEEEKLSQASTNKETASAYQEKISNNEIGIQHSQAGTIGSKTVAQISKLESNKERETIEVEVNENLTTAQTKPVIVLTESEKLEEAGISSESDLELETKKEKLVPITAENKELNRLESDIDSSGLRVQLKSDYFEEELLEEIVEPVSLKVNEIDPSEERLTFIEEDLLEELPVHDEVAELLLGSSPHKRQLVKDDSLELTDVKRQK
ncbi:hypothetical protein WICMUC_000993 [Wickerhamomyces mucosus]|uniref:Uncharacterized protein n=1 Tax=Wickerhamomyces mucosus TaxID=1378264 RepID=A0A9P8PW72_9ASCO|nr:hypothetical protein WICMUC_000993 [Wickerhamomyces mucosus]